MRRYIQGCQVCVHFKGANQKHAGPLKPLLVLAEPWQDLIANFIIALLVSKGYDFILIIVDWFSKKIILVPMTKDCTSQELAQLFIDNF